MRFVLLMFCLGILGCFRTIDTGPGGDPPPIVRPGPRPIFPDAGPRDDSGPFFSDSGPLPDSGPFFFDSAVPDSTFVPDASLCACVTDSDCPEPPPFGCGRALCAGGRCVVGLGSACDVPSGEACNPDTLECLPDATEIEVRVVTDYEPFVDFDRLVVEIDGRVVLEDSELAGDPTVGLEVPAFSVPAGDYQLALTLYLGCGEVARRLGGVTTNPPGESITTTFVITQSRLGP